MKLKFKIYCLLFTFLISLSSPAQNQTPDEELAAQYLANKEYAKAAELYEKLLSKKPSSIYFYDNLLRCYINASNFQEAQKLVRKQSRKFNSNYFYLVDAGYLMRLQNDNNKADVHFKQLISDLDLPEQRVFELAKAFEKRNEKKFAIESYLKGRKLLKNEIVFSSELAGLYADLKETRNMVEEYLNLLVIDEIYLSEVQGLLQNYLQTQDDFEILKSALQKRTRNYPERTVFQEMLIWLHVQKNEYELATVYAKAIDKRFKEDGRRLIELGFLASSNEKYDAAIQIYKQVQNNGKDKPYYSTARNAELEARSKKLLSGQYNQADLLSLENEYNNLLNEFGKTPATAATIRSLAHLEGFYLHKDSVAIKLYENVIQMPGVDRYLAANSKLELANFYVMKNDVWEAMLLYGQVDKDFNQDPLGQEAKFLNAKLSYYMGEFDWAKAQLDVLKTATTQLISNNAIELSLLIQDNTIDSNTEALKIFAHADLISLQGHFTQALSELDSIHQFYPKHSLSDDIIYKKGQIFKMQGKYDSAAFYFQKVSNEFGDDILGDNALYELAKLYQKQLLKPDDALKAYEKFLDKYPGSFYMTDVRKQYRILRGDQIN